MAYDINMWAADGPNSESLIKSIRIKNVAQIPEIKAYWSGISDCVRITKDRSSGNRETSVEIWVRPGHEDTFN